MKTGFSLRSLKKILSGFMPAKAPELEKPVEINLDRPMKEVLAELTKYPVKTRLNLSGTSDCCTRYCSCDD